MVGKISGNPNERSFQIPFVMGVTGHRDLRPNDIPHLEDRVRTVLEDFRTRLPSTPLLLLSALAGGADQVVASVALQCGVELVAVLPMPKHVYRSTVDAEAQSVFDELLSKASLVIDLPLNDLNVEQLNESEETRARAYDSLGRFLGAHCQALIALWDGLPSEKAGGTARVIQYMLEGPSPTDSDDGPQAGIVYHIRTPRTSNPAPRGEPFQLSVLTSLDGAQDENIKDFRSLAQQLEAFNREVMKVDLAASPTCGSLVPDSASGSLSSFEKRAAHIYFAADQLSLDFNNWTRLVLMVLLAFAFTALAGFEIYAHVLSHKIALWLVYPIALLAAWLTYRVARKHEIETKYFDYRALAEALRVQFFWSLAGIQEPVADHYLQHHRTELDWIRYALRSISIYRNPADTQETEKVAKTELALKHWVEHQAHWYSGKSARQQGILGRLDRLSRRSLFVVWLVSMIVPLSLLASWHVLAVWQELASHETNHGLLLLLVPLPSLAIGLFRVWVEQSGYDVQARKYHHMAQIFRRAAARVQGLLDQKKVEDARETLRRLGIEALEENGDWLLLHREHPLKVVGSA